MIVKLLTEYHLEFLSLKGGCTGSFESTLVKMPHCWKSHVLAQKSILILKAGSNKQLFYHHSAQFLFTCTISKMQLYLGVTSLRKCVRGKLF